MTAPLTDADLADARQLVEAATPGPWAADLDMFSSDEGIVACICDPEISMLVKIETGLVIEPAIGEWTAADTERRDAQWRAAAERQEPKDAAFIAASRSLVPRLLAEVERLRASCCHDYVGEDCSHRSKP